MCGVCRDTHVEGANEYVKGASQLGTCTEGKKGGFHTVTRLARTTREGIKAHNSQ